MDHCIECGNDDNETRIVVLFVRFALNRYFSGTGTRLGIIT